MVSNKTYQFYKAINSKLTALKLLTGDSTIVTMPHSIGFQSTCFCNLKCPHCQTHGTEEMRKAHNSIAMPEEMMRRVAAEVLPFATDYLFSVSGEPLAASNFAGLVEEFLPYQAKLQIHTNGTLFNKENLTALIPAAMRIYLSMDAATEWVFEATRKGARYKRVLHNIAVLTRTVELLPRELRPEIFFWCTIMGSNIRELPKLVHLAHLLGVRKVHGHFAIIFYDHIRNEAVEYHKSLYNVYYAKAHTMAADLGIELWLPPPFEGVRADDEAPLRGEGMIIKKFPSNYTRALELIDDIEGLVNVGVVEREAAEIKEAISLKVGNEMRRSPVREFLSRLHRLMARKESEDVQGGGQSGKSVLEEMKSYLHMVSEGHRSSLETQDKNDSGSIKYCESLYKRIYLSPTGDVRPCCYVDHVLGNVNNNSVKEIWNSETYNDCRRKFLTMDLFKECAGCKEVLNLPRKDLLAEIREPLPE